MYLFRGSTAVVQLAVNQLVAGSIPARGARTIGVWCNGNTTDFDSVILGSSPSTSAIRL